MKNIREILILSLSNTSLSLWYKSPKLSSLWDLNFRIAHRNIVSIFWLPLVSFLRHSNYMFYFFLLVSLLVFELSVYFIEIYKDYPESKITRRLCLQKSFVSTCAVLL